MVERPDFLTRTTLFADPPFIVGTQTTLGDTEAHHIRVLRLGVGERVALRDGKGTTAEGTLVKISKSHASVEVEIVAEIPPPPPIHLMVPVADRDRMLWLAEKATEFNIASWRPILWHHSKSVSPRGEGPTFRIKTQARMVAALLQSRSAWLPEIFPESPLSRAIAATPEGVKVVLDQFGTPLLSLPIPDPQTPITIAIGPEGGLTGEELMQLKEAGFTPHTLSPNILRFETAALSALAVAHSMQLTR